MATNWDLRDEMGEKAYNKACDRLNKSEHEKIVERYISGKKVNLKKDLAERLDLKGKTEKIKKYF